MFHMVCPVYEVIYVSINLVGFGCGYRWSVDLGSFIYLFLLEHAGFSFEQIYPNLCIAGLNPFYVDLLWRVSFDDSLIWRVHSCLLFGSVNHRVLFFPIFFRSLVVVRVLVAFAYVRFFIFVFYCFYFLVVFFFL